MATGDGCHLWCNMWKNDELKPHSTVMKKGLNKQFCIGVFSLIYCILDTEREISVINRKKRSKTLFNKKGVKKINLSLISHVINFEVKKKPFPSKFFEDQMIMTVEVNK